MRSLFVLRLGGLDAARQVPAGAKQVLLRIIQFIAIEIHGGFGLGQVEFQSIRPVSSGLSQLFGELLDVVLVHVQPLFRLLQPLLCFFCLRRERRGMISRVGKSRIEGQVHFVVTQPQGFPGVGLLFRQTRKLRELLRGLQRTLIHE